MYTYVTFVILFSIFDFDIYYIQCSLIDIDLNFVQGLDYFFHIKLHQGFQQPSNSQLLQTITIPNFFPANELLNKGWLPGRYIFEKNWTEVTTIYGTKTQRI